MKQNLLQTTRNLKVLDWGVLDDDAELFFANFFSL